MAEELENRRQLYNLISNKIVAWITDNGKTLDIRPLHKVVLEAVVYKDDMG